MAKGSKVQDEHKNTLRQCYGTPRLLFDGLNREFGFTIDACANAENAKLPRYWTKEQDALMQDWRSEKPFVNPPFGIIGIFMAVAWESVASGGGRVVFLIPPRTGTDWWRDYACRATQIDYFRQRIDFDVPEELAAIYEDEGKAPPASNAEDMCLVVFEPGKLDLSDAPRPSIGYRHHLTGARLPIKPPVGQKLFTISTPAAQLPSAPRTPMCLYCEKIDTMTKDWSSMVNGVIHRECGEKARDMLSAMEPEQRIEAEALLRCRGEMHQGGYGA